MKLLADELLGPFFVFGVARGRSVVDAGDDERHACGIDGAVGSVELVLVWFCDQALAG